MFEGLSVALVTPFRKGVLDLEAVDRLVEHLIEEGVQGFLPCGTTGEGVTLTQAERRALIQRVVARSAGRAWVCPGTGSNDTAASIERTKEAKDCGADGALVVTPYYNKPTQEGLFRHFEAIAREGGLPVMLYNVPSRTSVNLLPATAARLASVPNVVAIKEASGSLEQVTEVLRDSPLTLLSGDDALTLPILSVGGKGVVSVLGHITPRACRKLVDAAVQGRLAEAQSLHRRLLAFTKSLFVETNPAPVKYVLSRLGWIENELRLPLVPVTTPTERALAEGMQALGEELLPAASVARIAPR